MVMLKVCSVDLVLSRHDILPGPSSKAAISSIIPQDLVSTCIKAVVLLSMDSDKLDQHMGWLSMVDMMRMGTTWRVCMPIRRVLVDGSLMFLHTALEPMLMAQDHSLSNRRHPSKANLSNSVKQRNCLRLLSRYLASHLLKGNNSWSLTIDRLKPATSLWGRLSRAVCHNLRCIRLRGVPMVVAVGEAVAKLWVRRRMSRYHRIINSNNSNIDCR
jgi:hypothetical protein